MLYKFDHNTSTAAQTPSQYVQNYITVLHNNAKKKILYFYPIKDFEADLQQWTHSRKPHVMCMHAQSGKKFL
jgi:hypothetical protein